MACILVLPAKVFIAIHVPLLNPIKQTIKIARVTLETGYMWWMAHGSEQLSSSNDIQPYKTSLHVSGWLRTVAGWCSSPELPGPGRNTGQKTLKVKVSSRGEAREADNWKM